MSQKGNAPRDQKKVCVFRVLFFLFNCGYEKKKVCNRHESKDLAILATFRGEYPLIVATPRKKCFVVSGVFFELYFIFLYNSSYGCHRRVTPLVTRKKKKSLWFRILFFCLTVGTKKKKFVTDTKARIWLYWQPLGGSTP